MPKKTFTTSSLTSSTTAASSDLAPAPQVPETFSDGLPLPRLFVFDLDYTLWPFWVDTHVSGSLKPASKDASVLNTAMRDSSGETFTFYREVPGILYAARQKGITMGLASRTSAPDLAGVLLKNIYIPNPPQPSSENGDAEKVRNAWNYFAYREIYPGSKITHFHKIHNKTIKNESSGQIEYDDMVFFDDESRNREVEKKYGVTFVLVRDGVTRAEVDRGVREWRKRKGIQTKSHGRSDEEKSVDESESD